MPYRWVIVAAGGLLGCVAIGAMFFATSFPAADGTGHWLVRYRNANSSSVFGLRFGAASAAVFTPMMAHVIGWFETQRGLAVLLVSAGMGMTPMTIAPLAAWRDHRMSSEYLKNRPPKL